MRGSERKEVRGSERKEVRGSERKTARVSERKELNGMGGSKRKGVKREDSDGRGTHAGEKEGLMETVEKRVKYGPVFQAMHSKTRGRIQRSERPGKHPSHPRGKSGEGKLSSRGANYPRPKRSLLSIGPDGRKRVSKPARNKYRPRYYFLLIFFALNVFGISFWRGGRA